jgi:2',3'-cyclic-nucleotide 2'-phosphodiesterase (5'-nucleotidase family)
MYFAQVNMMNINDKLPLAAEQQPHKTRTPRPSLTEATGEPDVTMADTLELAGDKSLPKPGAASGTHAAGPVSLTILHTNDLHGYVEEHPPMGEEKIIGGFARLAGTLEDERSKDREGTITLDGGDFFEGGCYSRFTNGEIVAKAYDAVDFDAAAVGNHDMNWGRKAFKAITDQAGTDFLANNITDRTGDGTLDSVKPYKIIERKGLRIGIIGTTTPETASGPDRATLSIEDPVAKTREYVEELKGDKNVDLVILLSHLGRADDIKLAEQVKGIDVIVGSHSHTAIRTPDRAGDTLIVQAGGEGDYLGKLTVSYDPSKRAIVDYSGELIPITAETTPDPRVEGIIAPYMEQLRPLKEKILGHVDEDLRLFDRSLETTNLTNLYIDAQKKDSDVAVASLFSLRKGIPKGEVTSYDLYNAYPFDNKLLQVETRGAQVLKYLEAALPRESFNGVTAIVSGLTFEYDLSRPENQRITSITCGGKKLSRKQFEKMPLKVSIDSYTQGDPCFEKSPVVKKFGKVFDVLEKHFSTPGALDNLSPAPRSRQV